VTRTQNDFTWAQDGNGNSYIVSNLNTLDAGQPTQAPSMTTQSVDNYGNVTQLNYYNCFRSFTNGRIRCCRTAAW